MNSAAAASAARKWPAGVRAWVVTCVTIILAAFVVARYRDFPILALVVGLIVLVAGYLALVDFEDHRLPNIVTGPLALFATIGLATCEFIYDLGARTVPAIAFGVGAVIFFFVMHLLFNLGMGDVKYAYSVGFTSGWFGLSALMTAFMVTSIAAAIAAVVAVVATKNTKGFIAYGPYMSLGLAVALL